MQNFCPAAENNKQAILQILKQVLQNTDNTLEIGSGSGQHAIYFSAQLPHLTWQPTELPAVVDALRANLAEHNSPNIRPAVELNVQQQPWPVASCASIFTANTMHIMPWSDVVAFFTGLGQVLNTQGLLCIYGPFRYNGAFTTPSNERFNQWLQSQNPQQGIRDFEQLDQLANAQGLVLLNDYAMPANNQLLIWNRQS